MLNRAGDQCHIEDALDECDIITSGEQMAFREDVKMPVRSLCTKCGSVSSQPVCQACTLLDGLNAGLPQLAVGKSRDRAFFKHSDSASIEKD
ncbi:unnamed protein product [Echinostoma caproni]|uniref:Zn-ribbon_14 domain-containing protein n=1 Tax=Echinostoma caproni TaxID=27848 RepID=A0A183B794_9TREM|nr:unnamed protein product [Echinostoma caproni]